MWHLIWNGNMSDQLILLKAHFIQYLLLQWTQMAFYVDVKCNVPFKAQKCISAIVEVWRVRWNVIFYIKNDNACL